MRLVRIVSELDFGGVEKVLAISIPALLNHDGLKITVIVLGKGGVVSTELKEKGVDIEILGANPRIPNFKLLFKLRARLKKINPHVVHTQGSEPNFHGVWAAKLASVPLIIGEEIGIPNHHSYWKWLFKWVYEKTDYVIAISEAVKKYIVKLGEVEDGKVMVIYNPVGIENEVQELRDLENRLQKGGPCSVNALKISKSLEAENESGTRSAGVFKYEDSNTFVFVTTCRLVPIKNLECLIEVFSDLVVTNSDKNIRLDIIGNGPEKEKLEAVVVSRDLNEKVRILGFQANVFSFLNGSDVFVLPSLTEGSSVSLAEAMVAGLPSIVTKNGGASEILGHSESGFLIDPNQPECILKAMQKMIHLSPRNRHNMGLRAQKEAKRFSVDTYVVNLLEIYNK